MKTIAITGSSGFIGQHLVKRLQNERCKVIALDIKDGVDLLSEEMIGRIEKFDLLIHLAARSFVPDSYKQPLTFFKTNYLLTLHALEMCRANRAPVIFFSSYVYGRPQYLPIDESHPTDGFNPYAQSKLICEELCRAYNRHFDLPIIIVRPFNIYGPGQDDHFLITKIVKMAQLGKVMLEDPSPRRDFIFIDDVVLFVEKLLYSKLDHYNIFNIGSGESHSIQNIIDILHEKYDFEVSFSNIVRPNEISETRCNPTKAKNLLQWVPTFSFEAGLKKIIYGQ